MNSVKLFAAIIALTAAPAASGADFFSTERSESTFDIGVHFGINTTNRTMAKDVFKEWNHNSWGVGIDAGATVDINFRDWFSVQPGFFFESRSGNYAYAYNVGNSDGSISTVTQLGHGRSYNFTIPVMAAVHFNVTDDLRWNIELGPYFQFGFSNSFSNKATYPLAILSNNGVVPAGTGIAKTKGFDFGLKTGTSLTIKEHYNVGIHYEAGCLDAWKPSQLGGRNKGWIFSVGYIF